MNWLQSSNIASFAKTALKEAQKTIDKALDINENDGDSQHTSSAITALSEGATAATDFFASWGVESSELEEEPDAYQNLDKTSSADVPKCTQIKKSSPIPVKPIVTERKENDCLPSSADGQHASVSRFQSNKDSSSISDAKLKLSNHYDTDMMEIQLNEPAIHSTKNSSESEMCVDSSQENSNFQSMWNSNDGSIGAFVTENEGLSVVSSTDFVTSGSEIDGTVRRTDETLRTADSKVVEPNCTNANACSPPISNSIENVSSSHSASFDFEKPETSISSSGDETIMGNDVAPPSHGASVVDRELIDPGRVDAADSLATSSVSVLSEDETSAASSSALNHPETDGEKLCRLVSYSQTHDDTVSPAMSNMTENSTSSIMVLPSNPSNSQSANSSSFERVSPPPPIDSINFHSKSHKKGTSSASSSDIEIIPLDYNHQFCSPLNVPHKQLVTIETQTDISNSDNREATSKNYFSQAQASADLRTIQKLKEQIQEKDQEVLELRMEGEKLSKKQFDLSNIIKKLRNKEKDLENSVKNLKSDLEKKATELEKVTKTYIAKEEKELAQNELIAKLKKERKKLEFKIEELESKLEDETTNCRSMKLSLDNASTEVMELKEVISNAYRDSTQLDNLTRQNSYLQKKCDGLETEVSMLRESVHTAQSSSFKKESVLKDQNEKLIRQVQELELQLSDISSEVADATMPLSLEIDKLQQEIRNKDAQHAKKIVTFEAKVKEVEEKNAVLSEKEKSISCVVLNYQSQLANLEDQLESSKSKLKNNENSLEEKSKELEQLSEEVYKKEAVIKFRISDLEKEIKQLKTQREEMKSELENERLVNETERKKNSQLTEQILRMQKTAVVNSNGPSQGQLKSGENSPSSQSFVSEASYLDEVFDYGSRRSITPKSFFDSFPSSNVVESLHAQLRLRETEVISLQDEVHKNEKLRKTLNDEIANLTLHNQELMLQNERMSALEIRIENTDKKYDALLQMYGEKVEEADELRMDLIDVKEMYKCQIEQLLKK